MKAMLAKWQKITPKLPSFFRNPSLLRRKSRVLSGAGVSLAGGLGVLAATSTVLGFPGVTHATWFWYGFHWLVKISIALLVAAAVVLSLAEVAFRSAWLSWRVAWNRRHLLGKKFPAFITYLLREHGREFRVMIAQPSKRSAVWYALLTATAFLLPYGLSFSVDDPKKFDNLYSTLWQGHVAFASVALPLLIFIIELAKDEEGYATSEILIRKTLVWPVTAFALTSTLVCATGSYFYRQINYRIAFALFAAVIGSILVSYAQLLSIIGNRENLKRNARELLKQRLRNSLDDSVRLRLGNNLLLAELEQIGVQNAWASQRERGEVWIRIPYEGVIEDINVELLRDFVEQLPWRGARPVQPGERPTGVIPVVVPVKLTRTVGETVTPETAIVVLRADSFGIVDPLKLSRALAPIFRVRRTA